MEPRTNQSYVTDPKLAKAYGDYQARYIDNPRESDKKIGRLVLSALNAMRLDRAPRVLDIGCSTGNLLRHLRRLMPDAELTGGDLMASVIEKNRCTQDLDGIRFDVMDIFSLPARAFDIVVVNAVTSLLDDGQCRDALGQVAASLTSGGAFVGYEFIFPGDIERVVVETSEWNPQGLRLYMRSENNQRSQMKSAGFDGVEIQPFDIPVDLPMPKMTGTEMDLCTYTKRDPETGRRLMYRGALYQPWAHITARSPAT